MDGTWKELVWFSHSSWPSISRSEPSWKLSKVQSCGSAQLHAAHSVPHLAQLRPGQWQANSDAAAKRTHRPVKRHSIKLASFTEDRAACQCLKVSSLGDLEGRGSLGHLICKLQKSVLE